MRLIVSSALPCLALIVLLYGCGGASENSLPMQPTSPPTLPSQTPNPVSTPTPKPTATPMPTNIPTPTPKPTTTPTPKPTTTPTPSPSPQYPVTRQPSYIPGYYQVKSYRALTLQTPAIQIHIYGTANVSNWMIDQTYNMVRNILLSMKDSNNIKTFNGHHVFIITDKDPDVPGAALPGHKNTGNQAYTIINQTLICAKAADTIRPNSSAEWRAWDTPIHEFGHSIEHALRLESYSDAIFSSLANYQSQNAREYFSWYNQAWFNADLTIPANQLITQRQTINPEVFNYLNTIFDYTKAWQPSCAGRP